MSNPYETPQNAGLLEKTAAEKAMDDFNEEKEKLNKIDIAVQLEGGVSKKYLAELERDLTQKKLNVHKVDARLKEFKAKVAKVQKLVAEKNASSGEGGTEAQDDTPVSSLSASPGVDKATIEPKPRAGRKPEPSTPDERLANHQERARVALDDSEHELEDIKNLLWPHLTDEVVDKNAELQKIKKQLADDFLAQLSSLRDKVATILQNNETSEAKADALKELNNGEIMQFHHDKVQSVLTRAKRVAEGVGLTDLVAVIDKEQRGSGDNLELLEEIGRRGMKNIRISDGHRRAGVPIPEASSTPAPPESQSGAPQAQPKPAPSSVSSSASSTPPSPKLGSVVGGASAPKPAPPSSQTPQSPPIPVQGGYKEGAGPTFKKPEATPPLVPPSSPDEWAGYMGGIPKGVNPVAAWQAWKKENGSTPPPTAEPGEKNEAEDIMNPEFWNSAKFDLQVNREGLEKTLADNNISSTELPSWVDYERVYISELDSVNEAINAVGIGDTHRVQQLKDTLMEQNIALHSVIDKLEKEINYVVDGREKLKAGVNDTIVPSASSGGGGEGVADLTPRPNERTLDTFVIEAVGRPWPEVLEEFKDALARVKEKAVELGQGENVAIERSVKSAEDYIDGKTDFTGVFKNSELPVFSRRLGALNATLQLLDSIEKRGAGQAVVDTPTPVEVTPIDTGESLDRYDIKQFEGKTWADVILVWTTLRDEVLERANGLEGASTDEFISKALRNAQKTLDEHKIENDAELAKARVTRGELDTLGNRLIGLRECMTKMDRMEAERAAGPDGATEVTPVDGPEGEEVPERFVIKEIDTKNPEQLADELRACAERVKDAAKEKYGETPYPREVQDAIDQAQAHANSIQGISTDTLTERAQVRYRQYVEKLEGALGIIAQHTQVPGDADAPSAPGETQEHVPSSLSPENLQSLNTMREEVESKLAELEANGNITSDAKNPLKKNVKMWQEAGLWTKGDKERPDDPIGSARTISDILIQTADRLLEEGDTSAEGTVAIGDTPQEGGGEGSAIEELVAELNDLKGRRGNWKNTDGRGVRDKYTNDMRDLNPDELNAQEKSRNRLNRRIAELEAEIARRRGETVEDVHPGEEDTVSAPTEPIATTPEVVDPTQSSSTELFSAPSSETDAFKEGRERVATAREAYFEELRKYELGKSNVVWREFKRILPFTKVEGEPQALVDAGREYAESRAALMKEQNDERRQKLTARLTERFSEKNRGLQSLFLRDAGMDVGEASKLSQEDARVKYAELIQNRVEKWNWGKTYHDNVVGEFRQRNQILDQAREERASGAQKAAMQSFARAFQALPGWIKSTKVRRTVGITLAAGTGVAGATAALGTAPIWVAAGATAGVGFYGGSMLAGIGAHLGVGKYFEKYVKPKAGRQRNEARNRFGLSPEQIARSEQLLSDAAKKDRNYRRNKIVSQYIAAVAAGYVVGFGMRSGAAPAMWDHLAEELSSIQTTLDTSPTDIVNRPETAQPLASEVATPSTETEASPVELEEGEKPQAITDEKARSVAQMSEGIDIQPQLGEAYQESVTTPYGVRLPDETQRIDISQPADSVVPSETQPPSTSIDRQELDQMYAVQSEDPAVIQEQARLAIEAEREKELLDLRKNLSFDVKGGDNLENLIESRAADVYKGWTKAEYDTYSHLVAEQLRGMSGAELETLGIEGGNIDLIRPGEHINLTGIDPKILEDAYNQVADARVSPDAVPTSTESHQAPATPELNPDVPEVAPPTSYEQYSFANGENMQIPSEQFVELEKAATANMANDIRDYFTTSAWSPFSKDGELPYQKFVRDDVNGATKLLKTFSDGFVGVVEDPNMFNSDLNGEAFALENRPRLLHIYEGILQIARERGVDLDTFRKPGGLGKMSVVELLEKIEKEAVFSKLLESPRGLDAILAKAGADEILEKIVR